jgi:crotonobetainyl-CoA:carnitine CoA-transferase CaiB-like acyl-CoA transferase
MALPMGRATMSALSGLRVLDLSRVLAGPSCGQLLADFGAEVIKVEDRRGDENRGWLPIVDGRSSNFFSVNAGKRGLTLNLKSPGGQDILEKLVARSDVLIENFPPSTRERLGLGHQRLRAINDRLVQVSVTGYGGEGPLKDRPGYDNMLQGFSGMMAMTGEHDRGPARLGTSIVDLGTGMLAFGGVMAALFARAEGRASGQHVEVSLMQTAVAQLGYHFTAYTMAGVVPERGGSGVWHIVPYQAFATQDGWILAGATNDAAWQRMTAAMEADALAADPRFATNGGRVQDRVALIAALGTLFATRTTDDWMERLDAAKVPCSPVLGIDETLAHPQVRAMGMVATVPDDRGGTIDLCGVPLSLSETPSVPRRRPPDLGDHTVEILSGDLGLTSEDIETLRREGAI